VEIGHQRIGHPETIARIDEDFGNPAEGLHAPVRIAADSISRSAVVPTGITRPPAARVAVDGRGGVGRDLAPFAMHLVGGDVLDLDRQEGAGADMQRDMGKAHALVGQPRQQIGVEMQAGGGGGDGAEWRAQTVW
jgi:glutamate dehydrogenase/leucine dehydrogenase